jgi:Na+/H+ antiporter NhaC
MLKVVLYSLCGSFSAAVGVHLFIDMFQPKSVHFLVVSTLVKGTLLDDNLWLLVNSIVCVMLSAVLYKRIHEIITQHSQSRKK